MNRRRFLAVTGGISALAGCMSIGNGEDSPDPPEEPSDDLPAGGEDSLVVADDDADGDWLRDSWEIAGEAPNGLDISASDPEHRDLFVDIVGLEGAHLPTESDIEFITREFAKMPVRNPDGTVGIDVHIHGPRHIDLSIEEIQQSTGDGSEYIGHEHAQGMYRPEILGERTGIYHLLVIMPGDTYIIGKGGLAAYKVAMVKVVDPRAMGHELLRTLVGEQLDVACGGSDRGCDGYQSYDAEMHFSDHTVQWLENNVYHNVAYNFDE